MNSLKQLAATYGEDDEDGDEEEDFTSSLSEDVDKRGTKRSREDGQAGAINFEYSEADKSRCNYFYKRIYFINISVI